MNRRGLGNRNAGRRSAGLGSEGAVQGQSHAVGVRARVRHRLATRIRAEDVSCGGMREWRGICVGGEHWRRFAGQKYEKTIFAKVHYLCLDCLFFSGNIPRMSLQMVQLWIFYNNGGTCISSSVFFGNARLDNRDI